MTELKPYYSIVPVDSGCSYIGLDEFHNHILRSKSDKLDTSLLFPTENDAQIYIDENLDDEYKVETIYLADCHFNAPAARKPMSYYEFLCNLSLNEMANVLSSWDGGANFPWEHWFDNTYCKKCMAEVRCEEDGRITECVYCELHPNKCKFFDNFDSLDSTALCKMWLESDM